MARPIKVEVSLEFAPENYISKYEAEEALRNLFPGARFVREVGYSVAVKDFTMGRYPSVKFEFNNADDLSVPPKTEEEVV